MEFKESFLRPELKKDKDDSFLMSPRELDYKRSSKKPENLEFVRELNERIEEISGKFNFPIFDTLKEGKGKADFNLEEELKNKFEKLLGEEATEGIGRETKLIDVPEEILGKVLSPMIPEIRQMIYVQRDKLTLGQSLLAREKALNNSMVVYHMSDKDISGGLKGDSQNQALYFSSDIKRLFNLKEAKYIYAFRLNKNVVDTSRYKGGIDCFGRLFLKQGETLLAEDKIKIFDGKDPKYRQKVMDEISAQTDDSYSPVSSQTADWVKRKNEEESLFGSSYELSA